MSETLPTDAVGAGVGAAVCGSLLQPPASIVAASKATQGKEPVSLFI
jgi:hypothetical protein